MKYRPQPDTFMSEIYIYKHFEINDMESFLNRKFPRSLASIWYQDDLSILRIMPAVCEKPIAPPKSLTFQLSDVGSFFGQ